MKTTVIYNAIFLIIALMIGGCGVSQSQINPETGKQYSEQEYKIILDRKNFEDAINPIAKVKVDQNAKVVSTMLLEPGNPILYVIKMKGISMVHSIDLLENERLNINRVMIDHTDYFWDSVNRELLLVFNVPHAYLLQNEVRFKVNIVIEDDTQYVGEMQRYYLFWHKPMKENGEDYMSYEYVQDYSNLTEVDGFMRARLQEETNRVDMKRLDPGYQSEVSKVK